MKIIDNSFNENLYFDITDSGLPVYLLKRDSINTFYMSMLVNYGGMDLSYVDLNLKRSINIPKGTAHLLEHKLFESEDKNVFDKFAKQSAFMNAYTNNTSTVYYFTCTDYIMENILLFLELLQNPNIDKENVEKEKGIIKQEIRMYNDNPEWKLYNNFLQHLYIRNNVRYSVTGDEQDVQNISSDVIIKCYNDFYVSNNMALFVLGDIEPNEIFDNINKWWKRDCCSNIIRINPFEPQYVKRDLITESMDIGEKSFIMGFKENHTGLSGRDLLKTEVILNILLEYMIGNISPLFEFLYDSNYVDNSFGFGVNAHNRYMFTVISGNSGDPDLIKNKILEEIEKVKNKGIDDKSLKRIKKMMIGNFIKTFDSESSLINNLIFYSNQRCNFFDTFDLVNSIEGEDLMDIMKRSFRHDGFVMSIVAPNSRK